MKHMQTCNKNIKWMGGLECLRCDAFSSEVVNDHQNDDGEDEMVIRQRMFLFAL